MASNALGRLVAVFDLSGWFCYHLYLTVFPPHEPTHRDELGHEPGMTVALLGERWWIARLGFRQGAWLPDDSAERILEERVSVFTE